ncbi:MAG: ABC transporter ATP-binding protein [Kiritimatiellales bacterium]|nr:ABC transporter ATP-binding protein [Kiritimatiellales bacterium]
MMQEQETILKAEELKRSYYIGKKPLEVLKGVSLEVRSGESVSIMGASGSGKSTLLHVLGGLDNPASGKVYFQSQSVYEMSGMRRARFRAQNVGFVFQAYHLLPELDILENVCLPAMALPGREDVSQQAVQLLEEVGLGERIDHRPQELSGGEQQRVALARALINEPDIIFADEPTGNLDSKTGDKVLHYLFQLVLSRGHTLVLVTHNKSVAERCERRLVLEDGLLGR